MNATPGMATFGPSVSRRGFLAAMAAGSLVLAANSSIAQQIAKVVEGEALPFEPDLFLSIAPDGAVTIIAHRSEMGTGIRTGLPIVVADEMGADWSRVTIEQAIGDGKYGSQNTDGSRSVRRFYDRMRIAGATARQMLEQAAAQRWGVDASDCSAEAHFIVNQRSGQRLGFGDLIEAARALDVPQADELKFRSPEQRTLIGKNVPITDGDDIVTGRAGFGLDARRDGMLFAVIQRSPVLGGRVESFDDAAARAVPGVVDVIEIEQFMPPHGFQALGGVAVLAENTWAAIQGRRALSVEWSSSDNDGYNSEAFAAALRDTSRKPGRSWRSEGDADAVFSAASDDDIVEADYAVPLLVQAPMEPPVALAEVMKDASGKVTGVEVWAPTQNPQAAQGQLAATFSISPSDAVVHVTLIGGGFGRKSKPDFIVEAAKLSAGVDRPVQVVWTREDDIQHCYCHTVAAMHMKAAVGDDGMPTAWLQRSAFPSISSTFAGSETPPSAGEMGLGSTTIPYDIPNLQVESGQASAHVRIGWMRSVAHIYHAMGVCCFPDELAHHAGRDPYEYLMELLGLPRHLDMSGVSYQNHGEPLEKFPVDVGRLRHVTERVAAISGWGKRLPRGRAQGIACHRSFLSYCANVIEVEVSRDGVISIPKVHVVIDAGLVVMPDRVKAQMEGAATFGASLALYGEITAKNGAIEQSNFHDYRMTRMHDAPREVIVEIVESEAPPAGVGEVGVPPFAPALCNAIFAATGKRIRELPLAKHDLSW